MCHTQKLALTKRIARHSCPGTHRPKYGENALGNAHGLVGDVLRVHSYAITTQQNQLPPHVGIAPHKLDTTPPWCSEMNLHDPYL